MTQVLKSFYRGTLPRVFVDSAPHLTLNGGITLDEWRGLTASLRYRHIGNYRLDGLDDSLRAAGFDVLDFSANKRLKKWLDFNLSIDNLTNKRYFETQNYLESRICQSCDVKERIHGTPGYPITLTVGFTFRFGSKE